MGSHGDPADTGYVLQPVPGKGKGLISTRSYRPGDLILSEPPLFTTESLQNPSTIEEDLGRIVKSLPKDGQRAFLSLHNNNPGPQPFSNIVRSNGYPLGPSSDVGAIFPLVARINHSCKPNAQHAWNEKKGIEVVHAVREIKNGEELTLSYSAGGPSSERKANLKAYFGFDCACELCSLPPPELQASDDRLVRAQELDSAIGDPKRVRNIPESALADCHDLLRVYQEEGIFDLRLPRLYYDAFQICAMHSDQARASMFATKCAEAREICEGVDSVEAGNMRGLARKPKGFENFGATSKWKRGVDAVPGGLSGDEAEGWLWRTN